MNQLEKLRTYTTVVADTGEEGKEIAILKSAQAVYWLHGLTGDQAVFRIAIEY